MTFPSCSTIWANYPGTKLVGMSFKVRKRKITLLRATFSIKLQVWTFAENDKQIYERLKLTCNESWALFDTEM